MYFASHECVKFVYVDVLFQGATTCHKVLYMKGCQNEEEKMTGKSFVVQDVEMKRILESTEFLNNYMYLKDNIIN